MNKILFIVGLCIALAVAALLFFKISLSPELPRWSVSRGSGWLVHLVVRKSSGC